MVFQENDREILGFPHLCLFGQGVPIMGSTPVLRQHVQDLIHRVDARPQVAGRIVQHKLSRCRVHRKLPPRTT